MYHIADNFLVAISAELLEKLLEKLFSQIFQMHMLVFVPTYIDAASHLICYTIKVLCS